ncbi:MAG: 5'/3'-nucleotidase SurE, partial [Gammaproteobacteria bacterium]|nr:5'/3'-nucleotidase SurE [Gammaproteobacteria bacterium]
MVTKTKSKAPAKRTSSTKANAKAPAKRQAKKSSPEKKLSLPKPKSSAKLKIKRPLKVLISNDDGIYAPGINILADELKKCASVHVVAPDRNRSGASHSLTLSRPLSIHELDNGYISVEGTPSDCVHLALTGLYDETPDIVVSGINEGANLGDDVLYSGTVAAAMEGRFLGYPSIAVSLVGHGKHYETAAIIVRHILEYLQESPLPPATILNVNVPDIHYKKIRGIEVTKLGTRHSAEPTIKSTDPRGKTIYWIGPPGKIDDAGQGTDFHAIAQNKVSITPLHADF